MLFFFNGEMKYDFDQSPHFWQRCDTGIAVCENPLQLRKPLRCKQEGSFFHLETLRGVDACSPKRAMLQPVFPRLKYVCIRVNLNNEWIVNRDVLDIASDNSIYSERHIEALQLANHVCDDDSGD